MGEGMIVNFDGASSLRGRRARRTKSSPPKSAPISCDEARKYWSVENNIYQFGHRGYTAVTAARRIVPILTCRI